MNKKYVLFISLIILFLVCVYFLSVIFSSKQIDSIKNEPKTIANSFQNNDLSVTVSADTTTLRASSPADNLKNAPSSNIEITYRNASSVKLTDIQIKIYSVEKKEQYRTASTATAKFNEQATKENKHATYDVASVDPGQEGKAYIRVYAGQAGVMKFKANITTKEGLLANSPPISINVR